MKKPNFFIIGAPKSGTTALAQYLSEHPAIFFSRDKEPHFFNTDWEHRGVTDFDQYLRLFEDASSHHIAVGEGSTTYLASAVAVPNILKFNPSARFIVMVRNPIEMAPALHTEELYQFREYVLSFREAWHRQKERYRSRKLPAFTKDRRVYNYGDRCNIGSQIERLISVVGRHRVKLILFDDFVQNTRRAYLEVLLFLGVPSDQRKSFPKVNARKMPRSRVVDSILRYGLWAKRLLRISKGVGLAEWLRVANMRPAKPTIISDDLHSELVDYFQKEVDKLSILFGRDLTYWLKKDSDMIDSPMRRNKTGLRSRE